MAIFTSVTGKAYAGDLLITMTGSGIGMTDGTFEVDSIKPIQYEFDVPTRGESATAVGVNGGSVDITIHDEIALSDGTRKRFYEILEAHMSYADVLNVTVQVTNRFTLEVSKFYFELKLAGIKLEEKQKKAVLQCTHSNKNTSYISSIESSSLSPYSRDGQRTHIATARDFIQWSVNRIDSSVNKLIHSSAFTSGEAPLNTDWWFVDGGFSRTQPIQAHEQLAVLASLEGAIYGSGFDTTFYLHRLHNGYQQAIDYNTVEDLKIERFTSKLYNFIRVAIVSNDTYESLGRTGVQVLTDPAQIESEHILYFDPKALKSFNIVFNRKALFRGQCTDTANMLVTDTTITASSDGNLPEIGADAYQKSTGSVDGMRISLTFWDVFAIKPWQTFYLTNAPALYANKLFRPTSLQYDLMTNKTTGKAYQISTI